jgi:hypothetical protein
MLDTKLVLIEGLPGSGKSTLAQFLSAKLALYNVPVQCLLEETQPHPLHTFSPTSPPEPFAQGSLQVWQAFVAQADQSETITVAEGILFQNTIRLLMQNGMERQPIVAYADAVEVAIGPLKPILIYLTQADVTQAAERICRVRGAEFQAYLVRALTENVYAQQRGLTGFEGAVAVLRDYRALCDNLVAKSRLPKLVIETSTGEWPIYYQRVMKALALSERA